MLASLSSSVSSQVLLIFILDSHFGSWIMLASLWSSLTDRHPFLFFKFVGFTIRLQKSSWRYLFLSTADGPKTTESWPCPILYQFWYTFLLRNFKFWAGLTTLPRRPENSESLPSPTFSQCYTYCLLELRFFGWPASPPLLIFIFKWLRRFCHDSKMQSKTNQRWSRRGTRLENLSRQGYDSSDEASSQ